MSDAIIISGAPFVTGLNGYHYLLDPTATGSSRVWGNQAQLRIYFETKWKLANSVDGTVYFYQTDPSICNPWDVSGWSTDIAAYQQYASTIGLQRTDDEETTKTESESLYNYRLTEDTVFSADKVYYTRSGAGDTTNPYVYDVAEVTPGTAVPADTYYERDVIDRTTVTTTNIRTGKVTVKVIDATASSTAVQIQHVRYTPPKVEAGKVYRFAFVKDFQALGYIKPTSADYLDGEENDADITKGVFKIDQVTNYYQLVLGGVDIYQNLYLPLGISKEVYEMDRKKWMNDDVWYRLVNPMLPAKSYYVPTAIIEGVPDGNVAEYKRYHMTVDIGIFNDPDFLAEMVNCVNMLFKAHFGLPTQAELATYDSVWIPTCYYDWMEQQRLVNKEEFMREHSAQYFNTLFKNEYNQLAKENTVLKTQVKTYEEIIQDFANQ